MLVLKGLDDMGLPTPCPGPFPSHHLHTAFAHCFFNPFLPFSAVNKERHFSCEDCDGNVSGGFDASTSQVGIFAKLFSFLMFAKHLPHAGRSVW